MPNISIRFGVSESDDRAARVLVDGIDITKAVLADGFAVEFAHDPKPYAVVSMRLRVDQIDMDLPDSILNVLESTDV